MIISTAIATGTRRWKKNLPNFCAFPKRFIFTTLPCSRFFTTFFFSAGDKLIRIKSNSTVTNIMVESAYISGLIPLRTSL